MNGKRDPKYNEEIHVYTGVKVYFVYRQKKVTYIHNLAIPSR